MTSFLIASNLILWLCVIVLAFMVFALVRQIGVLYERVAPAGALSVNQQLKVGDQAPLLAAQDINDAGKSITIGNSEPTDKSQLLFFVSDTCPICNTLMPVIKSVSKAENDWVDLIFASDGDHSDLKAFIESKGLKNYPFINSELIGKSYGVSKLPYAILIDETGIIQSLGIVNTREHIESLFNAKEIGVASLQEYMQKNYA